MQRSQTQNTPTGQSDIEFTRQSPHRTTAVLRAGSGCRSRTVLPANCDQPMGVASSTRRIATSARSACAPVNTSANERMMSSVIGHAPMSALDRRPSPQPRSGDCERSPLRARTRYRARKLQPSREAKPRLALRLAGWSLSTARNQCRLLLRVARRNQVRPRCRLLRRAVSMRRTLRTRRAPSGR